MPTDVYICVISPKHVSSGELTSLNEDLIHSMGVDRFPDRRGPLELINESDCDERISKNLSGSKALIEASMNTSYYSKGYERGHWPEIATLLEFLRRRLPESTIFYGDDTGEVAHLVSNGFLESMGTYWSFNSDRPYRSRHI